MKKKNIISYSAFITVGMVMLFLSTASAQQEGIKRTELQRHDLSNARREAIQVRIDFAPGTHFGKHSHYGEELIYVLEGVFEYQLEDNPPITLEAGGVLFIPAGTIHAARNIGSGPAVELATYVVQKGKPLVNSPSRLSHGKPQ